MAKVPRHTKLMVWGTYDGWYRVETPDHIFGWVYHPYINAPARARLSELSHRKAKVASDRAAHQTMYGSADVLLRYYAQYGAPGAWRGLKKQGVQLAATAKPKSTLQTASRISKPQSDGITVAKSPNRQALSKITARPAMAPRPRTTPHIAAATTAKAAPKPVQAARPKAAKPSWRAIAWKRRQLRQQQQREQLRRRMGTPVMTAPPLSSPALPPISPEELMNAREAYVVSRNKNNAPAVQPGAPGGLTRGNGGLSDENSASLRPSSFTGGRASQPKGQVPLNRGGSPRDLFKYAAKPSPFSQGLVDQALSYRGMPYIRGAESPRRGFDCSGLVYFLLRQRGYNPPRTAAGYIRYGQAVPKDQLQPGDILLFSNTYKRGISHMGIYVGNGRFVHAARTGRGVRTDYLSSSYYGHKYYGARRVKSR
ncbi:MAG TPA: C40 family peptidase [Abditibacteriaceae bacterium]|nr:C40 family peptidase [Abditibacteriaceae bacterium]